MASSLLRHSRQVAFGIFLFLFAVYLLTYSGRIHIVDEAYMLAAAESLGKGRLDVNQVASLQFGFGGRDQLGAFGPSGDLFGKKGLALSLGAIPPMQLPRIFQGAGAVHAALLTNAFVTALTGSLLCVYLSQLGLSPAVSLVFSLVFGLCTLAWPYARWFFSEPVAALGLLLAVYGASRYHRGASAKLSPLLVSGFGSGLAVLAAPAGAIAVPAVLGSLLWSAARGNAARRLWSAAKVAGYYCAGLAIPLLMLAGYNTVRFGVPWDTGYRLSLHDFSLPLYKGLAGLLISPGRGLLFYSPVALLALPGAVAGFRKHRFDCCLALALVATWLVFYAKWTVWHGGWSWGPRYLVPIMPLLVLLAAEGWGLAKGRWRSVWTAVAAVVIALSFVAQVAGVSKNFADTEFRLVELSGAHSDDWYYLGREALFNLGLSPLVLQWRQMGTPPWDVSWLSTGRVDGVALGAALVAVLAGAAALWLAHSRGPRAMAAMAGLGAIVLAGAPVVLAHATAHPFYSVEADGRFEALAEVVSSAKPGDALVSAAPYLYELMMDRYPALPPVYGVRRDQKVSPEIDHLLQRAVDSNSRLWFLSVWTRPADPANETEYWLAQHTFPVSASEHGGYRLQQFSCRASPPTLDRTADVLFGECIKLGRIAAAYNAEDSVVQLALEWDAAEAPLHDYQVFVHLYNGSGQMVAQGDHSPVLGFRPTSSWQKGETVVDRIGLQVPPMAGRTSYRLAVGLYDWPTGKRLDARTVGGGVECREGAAEVAFILQ